MNGERQRLLKILEDLNEGVVRMGRGLLPALRGCMDAFAVLVTSVPEAYLRSEEDQEAEARELEVLDDRGYHAWTELWNGCRASVCRTPFGARICAGKKISELPQYAWDYATVREAEEALVAAEFRTFMQSGVVVSCHPDGTTGGEPQDYLRRWRYTEDGRMERF